MPTPRCHRKPLPCRTSVSFNRACSSAGCSAAHQGAVSHDQLDYYLDEFTFRFNRRRSRHRGLLFYRLLEGAVATEPHPYNSLTSESAGVNLSVYTESGERTG